MEEREAIALLKGGDICGLEALVRLHYVGAVRAAYLVCRDRALAEDIVQAAFLRAYERIHQFDASRPFAPWFLRSVVNDARKEAIRREHTVPFSSLPPGEEEGLASSEAALQELAEAAETSEAVWAALGELSPGQRTAIVQRYYLGLDEAEMSLRLAVQPGTVKWRLHRARERLRKLLPAWLSGEAEGTESNNPTHVAPGIGRGDQP